MWRIRTFTNTAWTDITPVIQSETPKDPSTLTAIELARSSLPTALQPLVHHLDEELEVSTRANDVVSASGTRDAIETWSAAAVLESQEYNWASGKIEAHEEALALYPEGAGAAPSTLVWHDRTLVILPITSTSGFQEFSVEYSPSLRDENRVERLRHRYATPEHELETILDWRGYFGPDSAVIDGWKIMRRQGHSYVASLTGTFGFIVAHVVRRFTRPQPTLERDPMARARLIQMSEAYRSVVDTYPDLAQSNPVQLDRAVVFVHGTASCGIQGLKDLPSQPGVIFRYEHDTFRPLLENSEELAELIQKCIRTKALLLVAHSRGGLVARLAADALLRKAYSAWIRVFTFGTPHNGTPLAAVGEEALNLLFKLSGDIVNGIPTLTPLGKAYSFLVKSPALPPGVAAMREGSGDLHMMNAYGDPGLVQCWGSNFRLDRKETGFGVFVSGMLFGAMNGIDNDLVVPTQSALGFGIPQLPVLDCSHTQYFQQQNVHQAIQSFFVSTLEDLKPSSPIKFKTQATGANG